MDLKHISKYNNFIKESSIASSDKRRKECLSDINDLIVDLRDEFSDIKFNIVVSLTDKKDGYLIRFWSPIGSPYKKMNLSDLIRKRSDILVYCMENLVPRLKKMGYSVSTLFSGVFDITVKY